MNRKRSKEGRTIAANPSIVDLIAVPRFLLLIVIVISFFPALLCGDSEELEGLSDKDIDKMEQGEVVISVEPEEDDPGRVIHAAFLIKQPVDKSWELIRQPERQEEFTARLKECTLVDEGPDSKVVRFLLKVLFLKVRYQINHIFDDEIYRADISLDPDYDNDLTVFDGTWRLYPVEEGITLARYSVTIRLSPLIPSFIQRFLARQSIPAAMEAWKRWIDSDGAWRKK